MHRACILSMYPRKIIIKKTNKAWASQKKKEKESRELSVSFFLITLYFLPLPLLSSLFLAPVFLILLLYFLNTPTKAL